MILMVMVREEDDGDNWGVIAVRNRRDEMEKPRPRKRRVQAGIRRGGKEVSAMVDCGGRRVWLQSKRKR